MDTLTKNTTQLNYKMASMAAKLEEKINTLSLTVSKLAKVTADLELLNQQRDKIQNELSKTNNLLKLKESDSVRLYKDNVKLAKERTSIQNKLGVIEHAKAESVELNLKLK